MPSLFEIEGNNLDEGYMNLRSGRYPVERQIAKSLEEMWVRFQPFSDPGFREAFARDPESRFWEMCLGCYLLDSGKQLVPNRDVDRSRGSPDFCIIDEGQKIWIEAVAPDKGEDDEDGIAEIVQIRDGAGAFFAPKRQIHLRITSALWTKKKKIDEYIQKGVVDEGDIFIVAIGAAKFGIYAGSFGYPLAISAVYPVGNEYLRLNSETLEVVEQGFEYSAKIERTKCDIPRTAFLDEEFKMVSGIAWSRVGIGNMDRSERPLSFIHNSLAANPLPKRWGPWDREYVLEQQGSKSTILDIIALSN